MGIAIFIIVVILTLLSIFRWQISFHITNDGDLVMFYWQYHKPFYLGYNPKDSWRTRKFLILFNIVS